MNATSANYTAELARFAANTTYASIPVTLAALLPVFILDVFSAMLAGVVQPVYKSAVKTIHTTYGYGGNTSFLAVDGTATSLSGAMLLNGIAAGDFEFEHVIDTSHPASSMFPALFAVAASEHKSGLELLTAMAIGYETAVRIGFATTDGAEAVKGFHNPGLNGGLATVAALGNLLGWNPDTIASGMGIAASSSAGLLAFVNTGAMTKRLHPARACQLGAEAAFMANAGIQGPANILENPDGYLHAFSPQPAWGNLTDDLGETWVAEKMILKLSPVHAYAQQFVYAVNQYRTTAGKAWDPKDIENVTIHCGPSVSQPSHWIPHPSTLVDAQYSVPFGIAAALTVDLNDPLLMNDALVANETTQKISGFTTFIQSTSNSNDLGGYLIVEIAGQSINITAETYPGFPGNVNYTAAADDKYERVTKGLNISAQGMKLKAQIQNVVNSLDVAELYSSIVAVGSAGVMEYFA